MGMGPEHHHRQGEDNVNLGVIAARLMTPMHYINWAEAQKEDPKLGATITWLKTDFLKECGGTEHLTKLKQLMGPAKDIPDGRVVLRTAKKLTLSGGSLISQTSQKHPRHHKTICHAQSTLQESD